MRLTHVVTAAAILAAAISAQRLPWAGHWKLDETSGTAAKDSAFFQNDGTLFGFTGKPWVPGKLGGALQFDGLDDYVQINVRRGLPIYDGLGSPYAVTFWVKAPAQNDMRVYSEGSSLSGTGFRALLTLGSGRTLNGTADKLQVFIRNDQNKTVINWQSAATAFDDQWHHVAWVDVAGMGTLYIDGKQDTRSWDYTQVTNSPRTAVYGKFTMDRVSLGAVLRGSTCCHLRGAIDDLRVYANAITAADVQVIMNGGTPGACRQSVGMIGYGCGPGPLQLAAGGSARLGGTLSMQLQQGTPGHAAVLLIAGPIAPLDLRWPGCRLYPPLQGLATTGIGGIDPQGNSAQLNLPVANNPWYVCQVLSFQGATLGGTPLAVAFSNGATAHFGN